MLVLFIFLFFTFCIYFILKSFYGTIDKKIKGFHIISIFTFIIMFSSISIYTYIYQDINNIKKTPIINVPHLLSIIGYKDTNFNGNNAIVDSNTINTPPEKLSLSLIKKYIYVRISEESLKLIIGILLFFTIIKIFDLSIHNNSRFFIFAILLSSISFYWLENFLFFANCDINAVGIIYRFLNPVHFMLFFSILIYYIEFNFINKLMIIKSLIFAIIIHMLFDIFVSIGILFIVIMYIIIGFGLGLYTIAYYLEEHKKEYYIL